MLWTLLLVSHVSLARHLRPSHATWKQAGRLGDPHFAEHSRKLPGASGLREAVKLEEDSEELCSLDEKDKGFCITDSLKDSDSPFLFFFSSVKDFAFLSNMYKLPAEMTVKTADEANRILKHIKDPAILQSIGATSTNDADGSLKWSISEGVDAPTYRQFHTVEQCSFAYFKALFSDVPSADASIATRDYCTISAKDSSQSRPIMTLAYAAEDCSRLATTLGSYLNPGVILTASSLLQKKTKPELLSCVFHECEKVIYPIFGFAKNGDAQKIFAKEHLEDATRALEDGKVVYAVASRLDCPNSPPDCQAIGRASPLNLERVWHVIQKDVTELCIQKKFETDDMKKRLCAIKGFQIFEASPFDKIWGLGASPSKSAKYVQKVRESMNLLAVGKLPMPVENFENLPKGENQLGVLLTSIANSLDCSGPSNQYCLNGNLPASVPSRLKCPSSGYTLTPDNCVLCEMTAVVVPVESGCKPSCRDSEECCCGQCCPEGSRVCCDGACNQ